MDGVPDVLFHIILHPKGHKQLLGHTHTLPTLTLIGYNVRDFPYLEEDLPEISF